MKKVPSEFLNVDLHIKSTTDLGPLVAALGGRVMSFHIDKLGRKHWVRLILARESKTPSQAILGFARLLERLPAQGKALWAQSAKEFDIGVQGGTEPASAEWVLEPEVIQAAARLGAQVRFTVYSPVLALGAAKASPATPRAARGRVAVEGYVMVGDALGTIIFDVEEGDALSLYDEFGTTMRETYRQSGGHAPWVETREEAERFCQTNGVKGYSVSSSIGFTGAIWARSCAAHWLAAPSDGV